MFFLETDWDVDRVTTLLSEVENFPGTTVQSDKLKWRYPGMGFSVWIKCTRAIVWCKVSAQTSERAWMLHLASGEESMPYTSWGSTKEGECSSDKIFFMQWPSFSELQVHYTTVEPLPQFHKDWVDNAWAYCWFNELLDEKRGWQESGKMVGYNTFMYMVDCKEKEMGDVLKTRSSSCMMWNGTV